MADISNVKAGQVLSFKLHTKLLRDMYTRVPVLGVAGYEIAKTYTDVDAIHANIYGDLPEGTPESPSEYDYLLIKDVEEKVHAVGVPWIKDPVRVVKRSKIHVEIDGDNDTVDLVRKALNGRGITNFKITVG